MNLFKSTLLSFCGLVFLAPMAHAQFATWANPAGGDWNNPANWDTGVPNSSTTTTVIPNQSSSMEIDITTGANSGSLLQMAVGSSFPTSTTTLDISSTGALTSAAAILGGGSNVTLNINGGSWTNTGMLAVAYQSGTTSINLNSGMVSTNGVNMGILDPSQSNINVLGGAWVNSGTLLDGSGGSGQLQISNGSLTTGNLTLAGSGTSSGSLSLSGGTLTTGQLQRGSGTGVVAVSLSGGTLQLGGDQANLFAGFDPGEITLTGAVTLDTQNHAVATSYRLLGTGGLIKQGTGTLTLSGASNFSGALSPNQGTLTITGSVISGATSGISTTGSTATLNITGSGANWTSNNDTLIGDNGGTGNLNITGGATASDTFSLVGRHFGGTGNVTVDGSGSTWTHSAGLVIGTGGVGTMLVENGGQVSNTDGTIGGDSNSSGTVRVTGTGSLWTSTSLLVGSNGTGVLNVDAGGTVQVGSTGTGVITLGNAGTASGTLNIGAAVGQTSLDPGTILAATITGGDGTGGNLVNFNHTGTSYTFAPNMTGNLSVQQNGGVTILTGSNSYSGGTTVNSGTLVVGNNSALGTGAANVSGGTLQINSGFQVANTINLSGGSLAQNVVTGTKFSTLHDFTSTIRGGTPTTAQFLDGLSSGSATITGSFSHLLGTSNRLSDVLSLNGVSVVNATTGQTDTFVLQMKLDPSLLSSDSELGWFNPNTNEWVNAVLGNIGGTADFIDGAYDPSTDFVLGDYGIDLTNGTVWAVLDHNSDFAVTNEVEAAPEPGTWLLLGLGFGALVLRRKTRTS